jgi:hypothetical protein
MKKIRIVHNALIIGTASLLYVVSASAEDLVLSPRKTEHSAPILSNEPVQGSLGTLRANEIPGGAQMAAFPSSTSGMVAIDDGVIRPVQVGDVVYVTGGVGDEERAALQAMRKDYNLEVLSSRAKGEFAGEVRVAVLEKDGVKKLDAPAGPMFYAKLPPGTYTVEATCEGVTKQQKVTVGQGKTAYAHFNWK